MERFGQIERMNMESRVGGALMGGALAFSVFTYADIYIYEYPPIITSMRIIVTMAFVAYLVVSSNKFGMSNEVLSRLYSICIFLALVFTDILYAVLILVGSNHLDRAIQVGMVIVIGTTLMAGNSRRWIDKLLITNFCLFTVMLLLLVGGVNVKSFFSFFNFFFFNIMTIVFNRSYIAARKSEVEYQCVLKSQLNDLETRLVENIRLQDHLVKMATFDDMTGLMNRRSGLEVLHSLISAPLENYTQFAICFF